VTVPWAASLSIIFPSGVTNSDVIKPNDPKPYTEKKKKKELYLRSLASERMNRRSRRDLLADLGNDVRLDITIVVLQCHQEPTG
jgi:hypothetical protein